MDDAAFLDHLADALAGVEGVEGVTLGGSRARVTATAESYWDLAVWYRPGFDPQAIRDLGWKGEVSELGGWGGGVFDGGGWMHVDGRAVDVHFRSIDAVTAEIARAERGEFHIEPLLFHLAGIPSYLLVAETAGNVLLRGAAPRAEGYPPALRERAPATWAGRADATFGYAATLAASGRALQSIGLVAVAVTSYAHAIAAARGVWVTNEKRLLAEAGLEEPRLPERTDPASVVAFAGEAHARCRAALAEATRA